MADERRPNVILIQADQLRYDALGCTGNAHAVTPNIDRLAASGSRFDRHFAANPVCMPSRASLFTGRYPSGHGLWHNGVPLPRECYVTWDRVGSGVQARSHESRIISQVPTMADAFANAAYDTRAIGKLHLSPTGSHPKYGYEESRARWESGELADWHGPYYGFQHVDLAIGHGEATIGHYRHWLEAERPDIVAALEDGQHRRDLEFPDVPGLYPSVIPVEAHHSAWIAERAMAYLQQRRAVDEPFFLYLGFPDPHHPFTPPAELAEAFARRHAMAPAPAAEPGQSRPAVVSGLRDYAGGRLSTRDLHPDAVTRIRQYTDAMVHLVDLAVGRVLDCLDEMGLADDTIVIVTSDHGDWLGDQGLLLKDTVCFRALAHVPFIMRAPGLGLPTVSKVPMSNSDVLPTVCDLTGVPEPDGVQGSSVIPDIDGCQDRLALVYGYQHEPARHNFSVFDSHHRFTLYPASGERELYDHRDDPNELHNLVGSPEFAPIEDRLYKALAEAHLRHDNPAGGRISRF